MSNSTSSAKHTAGPWHWDSDPIKGDPLGRVRYRVVAVGRTITQCYYSSGDEQAEPDARLIAAAPDLLEAAQAVVARWDTPLWKDVPPTAEFIGALRAAIVKAQGGAS